MCVFFIVDNLRTRIKPGYEACTLFLFTYTAYICINTIIKTNQSLDQCPLRLFFAYYVFIGLVALKLFQSALSETILILFNLQCLYYIVVIVPIRKTSFAL